MWRKKRKPPRELVLESWHSPGVSGHRTVTIGESGGLHLFGHDVGSGPGGSHEYEFHRRLSASKTDTLRDVLGLAPDDDLLDTIGERFDSSVDLEATLREHGLDGEFSNWIGD